MSPIPRVSVVMPAHNALPYLAEAIESILQQTFRDFELIIVDDASQDFTWQVITDYAAQDPRIIPLQNEQNMKSAASRNRGCSIARGEYIAIQDADDRSCPRRLELQVSYLDVHPEIGVLGAKAEIIDLAGKRIGSWGHICDPLEIHATLNFHAPFTHGTLMIRREILLGAGGYSPEIVYVDDVELQWRLSRISAISGLPDTLYVYRNHDSPQRLSSSVNKNQQQEEYAEVQTRAMNTLVGNEFPRDVYKRFWMVCHTKRMGQMTSFDICRLHTVWKELASDTIYAPYYAQYLIGCYKRLIQRFPLEAIQLALILWLQFGVSAITLAKIFGRRFILSRTGK